MSDIPYNYGSYIDAKVNMTDNGHVDSGKQMQSPASAGSRGLAKTTQFTNNPTQMQMGNSPIAESMIQIQNILSRIDGICVPVSEDDVKPIMRDPLDSEQAKDMQKDSDYLYLRGKEIDQGSIMYKMEDYSDGIFELQSANYADGTELDEKELEELESTQELIDWVMIDFVSESTSEDAGELARMKELAGMEDYTPMPEGDEFDIEEDEDFEEVLGPLGFPEDETELFDAEYQGRKVPLNKPMRGDVKKFKVYVKDPKSGNVKKVNFGHGGTSAKRPTMRIRKSNPKARKSFRARHNCANPGPKTKARYWSCRKW